MLKIQPPTNDHFTKVSQLYDDTLAETESKLLDEYRRAEREVENKIKAMYLEIKEKESKDKLLVSDLYKYNKYYDVMNTLNQRIIELGGSETGILENSMLQLYKANNRILSNEFHIPVFSDDRAIRAINTIWCQKNKGTEGGGLLWSKRIWGHCSELVDKVEQGMLRCVTEGASSKELAQEIRDCFGIEYKNAVRLARTECAHIQSVAACDSYIEAGYKYVKVLTKGDMACSICQEAAQNVYSVDAPPVPLHPNCACVLICLTDEEKD